MFQAIACSLLLAAATPVIAQDAVQSGASKQLCDAYADTGQRSACMAQGTQYGPALAAAFEQSMAVRTASSNTAVTANAFAETGKIGDPDSWVDDEFRLDWGLGAINAQHAYARGLSGQGIMLGVMDSGVFFGHSEFDGKQNVSITMADVLADGSRCTTFRSFGGPTPCFATHGDEAQLDYVRFNDNVPQNIRDIISNPNANYTKPGFNYESHGTHVAGTIAANRDGFGMHGVAFGANIASARRFYDTVREWARTPTGYSVASVIAGPAPTMSANAMALRDMAAAGVRAVNHSWGYTVPIYDGDDLDGYYNFAGNRPIWDTFVDASRDSGMIQVWSAGNIREAPPPGMRAMSGLTASLPRYAPDIEKYWLSVVNVLRTGDANNPHAISSGSMICGEAKQWCIAAPGTAIASAAVGGNQDIEGALVRNPDGSYSLDISHQDPGSDYAAMSGTSMSAPHVTGALGLLFERFAYLDNAQVRDILLTTATDIGAPGVDEIYGWGLINLQKAIEGYGQFRVDTDVTMATKAGGAHVWNDARVWDVWSNDIGGPGHFSFTSPNGGWLRLSGNNSFNGLTVKGGVLELSGENRLGSNTGVDGGLLLVNGMLESTVRVNAGGTLGGSGTIIGNVNVAGGLAPGASIGMLSVIGNYVQEAGSRFFVEMQPPSATDQLLVYGAVTLNGGTVVALRQPGVFGLGQSYNFLSAQNGITGQFAGVDNSNMGSFLKMTLSYGSRDVYAQVVRAAALASVANTSNQANTARALDSLADSNTLLQRLVLFSDAQALAAFDQLSGEAHASLHGVLTESSRHLRNAALTRARTGHDAFTSQAADAGIAVWVDAAGKGGMVQSDGNAASANYDGSQFLIGVDYQLESGWRFGLMGGTDRTDMSVGHRNSKAEAKGKVLGVYGGQRFGGFGLHAGYVHNNQDIRSDRRIAIQGYTASHSADYDATSRQAFIEGGYRFGGAAWEVEPYLQYAKVKVETDGFSESAGVAALSAGDVSNKVDLATGGVRFNLNLKGSQQEETWLSLRGGLGYRKASGDRDMATTLSFVGSNAYVVNGAPIAKSATVGELGLGARLSERALLELGYSGQFSKDGNDHGANARLSIRF
ncbi:MAG: S8 family serine peptidase [Pseudomonadota bacterium]|nr:S8 family serine peptidase [Pseudomonadota bacterium]